MSPKLPVVKPRKVIRVLESLGFRLERQTGSHMIFVHPDGRLIPLPFHSDRDLKPGLMRRIIRDAGVSVEKLGPRVIEALGGWEALGLAAFADAWDNEADEVWDEA